MRSLHFFLILALSCLLFTAPAIGAGEMVGTEAPPFKVELLEGGELDLSESLGNKVIMLDFWSIYCVSCVQEMPYLVDIQSRYPDELLTVGVDLDSFGTKRVKKFVSKLKFDINYPIVVDRRRQVAALYKVSVLPTTIVIDKNRQITYYHVGYKPGDEVEIENSIKAAIAAGK